MVCSDSNLSSKRMKANTINEWVDMANWLYVHHSCLLGAMRSSGQNDMENAALAILQSHIKMYTDCENKIKITFVAAVKMESVRCRVTTAAVFIYSAW